jgi:carboxyl-terminal processing protease
LLDEAADVVNLFVDSGVIVSTIGRVKEEKEVKTAKSGIARTDIPMVVLVNANSASAAEIVAGALKDHRRAVIMGTRTFGKGSVQTVIPLADDVGLKLTIARYYTPNGTSIQAKGIEPDVELQDIDAETFEKIKAKNRSVRESDLKNHFDNEEGEVSEENEKVAENDTKKAALKALEPPKPMDPRTDYQVQQALNYLSGIDLMRSTVTAPSVSSKTN